VILRHSGIARGNRSCCSTVRGPHRAGCRFSAHLLLQWYLGTALLRQFWNCVVWCMGCVHSVLHGVPLHRCDNRNCEDACCVRFFQVVPQRHFGCSRSNVLNASKQKSCLVIFRITDVYSWNTKSFQRDLNGSTMFNAETLQTLVSLVEGALHQEIKPPTQQD
jgi:hypothetical protein